MIAPRQAARQAALQVAVAALLAACPAPSRPPDGPTPPDPIDAGVEIDAAPVHAPLTDAAPIDAPPAEAPPIDAAIAPAPPTWLRGSTHVHAAPSGDATLDPVAVMAWYREHGYDFIVLTDHNRVTALDPFAHGRVAGDPEGGVLVLAGTELTYNPSACTEPDPPPQGKCRIHVNALGVTARPVGRLEWADRARRDRRGMYQAALVSTRALGGIAQLNHPQWHWGMTGELLTALAADGFVAVEVSNAAFASWGDGDDSHPSVEALWDQALLAGARLWAVASDDAHSYDGTGKYPAGGGWIMVDAARDGDAIIDAIAAGRFYASTGVALAWAGPVGSELRVELAPDEPGPAVIAFIVNGAIAATTRERTARHPIPATGYVRAVIRRDDGARAWVQPARR